jgi:hypothetical protein
MSVETIARHAARNEEPDDFLDVLHDVGQQEKRGPATFRPGRRLMGAHATVVAIEQWLLENARITAAGEPPHEPNPPAAETIEDRPFRPERASGEDQGVLTWDENDILQVA